MKSRAWLGGGEWQMDAAFLMPSHPHPPSFLQSLLSPRLHDCQAGGRERAVWDWVRFSEQLLQYPIYKSSPGEKEWFLAEFYVRRKEKHNLTASSLGYGLFCKK